MGKSKTFRSFDYNGDLVTFSPLKFRELVKDYQRIRTQQDGTKPSLDVIYSEVAENVGVSADAVKNWYKGVNGVGDSELIKKVAVTIGADYRCLLEKRDDREKGQKFDFTLENHTEREIIKRIYQLMVDYIYWFIGTQEDYRANRFFDNPYQEMINYMDELYHCLDSEWFSLKQNNYKNLRKTITELDFISRCTIPSIQFPKEWYELNPLLSSSDFRELYDDFADSIYDVLNNHDDMFDDPEKLLRMYFEDLPELLSEEYENAAKKMGRTRCQVLDAWSVIPDCSAADMIVREVNYTLKLIMKKRFPDYLGDK